MIVRMAMVATWVLLTCGVAPAQADHEYKFFHFNMAGNAIHTGNDTTDDTTTDSHPGHADPVMALKDSLTGASAPAVASINEMCRNQFEALLNQTGWEGVFAVAKRPNGDYDSSDPDPDDPDLCFQDGKANQYGNAILAPNLVDGTVARWDLPYEDNSGETRKLMCVGVQLVVKIKACNAHVAHTGAWGDVGNCTVRLRQSQQVFVIKDKVGQLLNAGHEAVVMGDFNLEPDSGRVYDECSGDPDYPLLDYMYDQEKFGGGAQGRFKEVGQFDPNGTGFTPPCRCGEFTHKYKNGGVLNKRIDYIFLNAGDWRLDGDEDNTGKTHAPIPDANGRVSDHVIVRGRAHLTSHP